MTLTTNLVEILQWTMTKATERSTRDLDRVKCIKDEAGLVLVREAYIKLR